MGQDWREHGVRIVNGAALDLNTPQSPGMTRAAAITHARTGAEKCWGEELECMAEAGPGDFIYVPPWVPHQEMNANPDEPLSCVLVRSGQDPVVVNLDIAGAAVPEVVYWVDDIHKPAD